MKNDNHLADVSKKDLISRADVCEILSDMYPTDGEKVVRTKCIDTAYDAVLQLPTAQPEIIRCKDCVYYDPPHVENNGVRSEYSEMPEDSFDVLGVGLVSAEYGINIGGRCCRDYNVSYSEDKRVFIPETNYCGRAERRTDE